MSDLDGFVRHRIRAGRGTVLSVLEGGDRSHPTLLFLHGAGGNCGNFSGQLKAFRDHYHLVAPDLRGHGLSGWPGDSRLLEFHQDVDLIIDELELPEKFVVISHSFGGCLAARLAERAPGRVQGLALLNTAGHIARGPFYQGMLLFAGQVDRVRRFQPDVLQASSRVCWSLLRFTLKEWNCWDAFPRLEMPSLVLSGGLDHLIPVWLCRRTARLLPDSRLITVPLSGHVTMMSEPERVNDYLRNFLAEVFGS